MVDKKKRFRIRLLILILSGGYLALLTHLILRSITSEYTAYVEAEITESIPHVPELIDLSTEEGGQTVTIQFLTKDTLDRNDKDRKRYIRIFVDGKEVVSRLCDFWLGPAVKHMPLVLLMEDVKDGSGGCWSAKDVPIVFRPRLKLNLGSHGITVEDKYYNRWFSGVIEITRNDLETMKREERHYLSISINFANGKIEKVHKVLFNFWILK